VKANRVLALVLLGTALFVGCRQKPVAVVNGEEITEEMVQSHLDQRLRDHKAQGAVVEPSAIRSAVVEQLISEVLIAQGARESGITISQVELDNEVAFQRARRGEAAFQERLARSGKTLKDFREEVRERLLVSSFINALVPDDAVTEEDVRKFYQESPTPFLRPEQVEVRFVQVRTVEAAKGIMKDVVESGEFDAVAERLKAGGTAVVSDYGWTAPGVYSPVIAEALRETPEGGVTGPHAGADGHFLFRVRERRPEGVKDFEDAKQDIRDMMMAQRRQTALIHWVAEKKQAATIVRN
jgi:parvulin-like peptidyl-prolyl isomerase